MSEILIKDVEQKMINSINHLIDEFSTIRTGRANPSLVDKLNVEYYGTKPPLQQLATISVPDPKLLVIQPEPTSSENGEVIKYDYPSSIDHGDTSISDFPSGAEYAVVLGAAAKFMFKLASEDQSNEDIELATNTAGFAAQLKQEYEKELQRVTQQK